MNTIEQIDSLGLYAYNGISLNTRKKKLLNGTILLKHLLVKSLKLVLTSLIFPQAHLTAAGKENGVLKTLNPESQNPKKYFSKNEETKDFPSKVKFL